MKSFIKIRNVTMRHIMMGVMYFLNRKAILRFFAPFRKSLLLSRRLADCAWILVKLLSRFSSISKDSVIILFTSISSWFSLSRFSCAFISLNSFFFLRITRSNHQTKLVWISPRKFISLTKLKERVLVLDSLNFGEIVNIVCWAICVSKLIVERMSNLLQEYKD